MHSARRHPIISAPNAAPIFMPDSRERKTVSYFVWNHRAANRCCDTCSGSSHRNWTCPSCAQPPSSLSESMTSNLSRHAQLRNGIDHSHLDAAATSSATGPCLRHHEGDGFLYKMCRESLARSSRSVAQVRPKRTQANALPRIGAPPHDCASTRLVLWKCSMEQSDPSS